MSEVTTAPPKENATVLIVEDEIMIRLSAAEFLREFSFRILEAANAREVQALVAAGEQFDIMLTDVSMPGEMNGFGLAAWIRKTCPEVAVIVTSGFVDVADLPGFLADGGTFLPKPYSYDDLLLHVKRLTAGRIDEAKKA